VFSHYEGTKKEGGVCAKMVGFRPQVDQPVIGIKRSRKKKKKGPLRPGSLSLGGFRAGFPIR